MAKLSIIMAYDPPSNNVEVDGLGREDVELIYEVLHNADPLRFPPKSWTWNKVTEFYWPTEYRHVNQPFGINAETYKQWGLPGHEGIDLQAPEGSKIFTCTDGIVISHEWQHRGEQDHPYGKHIRVQHDDGLTTIYAHLSSVNIGTGEPTYKGELIGLAGNTGNSTGPHLHLTLKKAGATAAGETNYPNDIIDPSPYLGL